MDGLALAARADALAPLKAALRAVPRPQPGGGDVRLVVELADRGRELEIPIPGRWDVSPSAAGTLSTLPGVREVVEL